MRTALLAAVVFTGCQCFTPVDDFPDAGPSPLDAGPRDGGPHDAGTDDAGLPDAGVECRLASDCALPDAGLAFCTGAAMSCISNRCVLECQGGRACLPAFEGLCLLCTPGSPPRQQCPGCARAFHGCVFEVEREGCPGTRFEPDSRWRLDNTDGGCERFELSPVDGGLVAGTWYAPDQQGQGQATIPELGGQCTLQSPATGAPRLVVQCPRCSFVEVGCE